MAFPVCQSYHASRITPGGTLKTAMNILNEFEGDVFRFEGNIGKNSHISDEERENEK